MGKWILMLFKVICKIEILGNIFVPYLIIISIYPCVSSMYSRHDDHKWITADVSCYLYLLLLIYGTYFADVMLLVKDLKTRIKTLKAVLQTADKQSNLIYYCTYMSYCLLVYYTRDYQVITCTASLFCCSCVFYFMCT